MKKLFKQLLAGLLLVLLSWECGFSDQDVNQLPKEDLITLKRAVAIALQHNRSLQHSRLSLESSQLNVQLRKDDFDIKVVPATIANINSSEDQYLSAQLKVSKETKIGITASVTPQLERNGDIYTSSVSLMLNVPLLRGLGTDYNLDALYSSIYELESNKRSYYQQQINTVISTISTVYQIIKDQEQINLLSDQVSGLEKHLLLTKVKEKTGLASTMDLYRAELRLKEVQNELTTVNEQIDGHIDQLKDLLSIPMQGELTVTAPVDYMPVVTNLEDAVAIALENRIELEQSKQRSEESRRRMLLAKHNILPTINFNMGYRKYGENNSFQLDEEDWVVGLNGATDVLRSQERTAFKQANISYKQSKIDLESTRESIVREVRAQINKMEKTETLIIDRREQERQAQGKLELAFSKFNHDLADNFDLLEAQSQLQEVQSNLLFDTISYIVDTYRLRSVLGTLIER